jgi:hypothetical protein
MSIPLSAYSEDLLRASTALTSALAQLTAYPANPYEATKLMLFGENYEFLKLSAVEVPEEVTYEGIIETIVNFEKNFQTKFIDTLVNPSEYNIIEPNKMLTPLAELSGDNTYVVTEEKLKSYIEYYEMLLSIDINSINDENCYDLIKKYGYACVKMLGKKTIPNPVLSH